MESLSPRARGSPSSEQPRRSGQDNDRKEAGKLPDEHKKNTKRRQRLPVNGEFKRRKTPARFPRKRQRDNVTFRRKDWPQDVSPEDYETIPASPNSGKTKFHAQGRTPPPPSPLRAKTCFRLLGLPVVLETFLFRLPSRRPSLVSL